MITILEHGTRKTVKCGCCRCKFMFDKIDTIPKDKINEVEYSVNCPECNTSIDVTSLFVPVTKRMSNYI